MKKQIIRKDDLFWIRHMYALLELCIKTQAKSQLKGALIGLENACRIVWDTGNADRKIMNRSRQGFWWSKQCAFAISKGMTSCAGCRTKKIHSACKGLMIKNIEMANEYAKKMGWL